MLKRRRHERCPLCVSPRLFGGRLVSAKRHRRFSWQETARADHRIPEGRVSGWRSALPSSVHRLASSMRPRSTHRQQDSGASFSLKAMARSAAGGLDPFVTLAQEPDAREVDSIGEEVPQSLRSGRAHRDRPLSDRRNGLSRDDGAARELLPVGPRGLNVVSSRLSRCHGASARGRRRDCGTWKARGGFRRQRSPLASGAAALRHRAPL